MFSVPVTITLAPCVGSTIGQQLLSPQKNICFGLSAQASYWHLAYLDPFQPLWLSNFQVEQGHYVTTSLQIMVLKVRHETEELLLSGVHDAGTVALGSVVKVVALMHKPNRIAGVERGSGCESSTGSVVSTQVVAVPEAYVCKHYCFTVHKCHWG